MELVGLFNRLANYRRRRQLSYDRALSLALLAAVSLLLASHFYVTPIILGSRSFERVNRLGQSTVRGQHSVDSVVVSPSLISDSFVLS